jgi:hypothetical protein
MTCMKLVMLIKMESVRMSMLIHPGDIGGYRLNRTLRHIFMTFKVSRLRTYLASLLRHRAAQSGCGEPASAAPLTSHSLEFRHRLRFRFSCYLVSTQFLAHDTAHNSFQVVLADFGFFLFQFPVIIIASIPIFFKVHEHRLFRPYRFYVPG